MIDKPEVQFIFHARGERDIFRSYSPMQVPRIGETVVFGQKNWRVHDVIYDLDHQRIDVIAIANA